MPAVSADLGLPVAWDLAAAGAHLPIEAGALNDGSPVRVAWQAANTADFPALVGWGPKVSFASVSPVGYGALADIEGDTGAAVEWASLGEVIVGDTLLDFGWAEPPIFAGKRIAISGQRKRKIAISGQFGG